MTSAPRAIGIVRVSRTNKRVGERFASPHIQRERIEQACVREGLQLLRIEEEMDVSGGRSLEDRDGLGPAVKAVEAGDADVIVGAYFDRLFRSIAAQGECVDRVEKAGGRVLAVDVGAVSNKSAGQWLSGALLGVVAEYHRRTSAERVAGAVQRAIDRGVPPHGRVTAGYRKREDGRYEPDPQRAVVVARAFELRSEGATINEIREHLTAGGVALTYPGTYALFRSRVVLGEIHFGSFEPNLSAHAPIVGRELWEAVQRVRVPTGRKSKSERLLARLGVLRCATCDSKMSASTARGARSVGGGGKTYPIYKCNDKDCPRPASIMAHAVEEQVLQVIEAMGRNVEGRAEVAADARAAAAAAERQQAVLDALIAALDPSEPASLERLAAETTRRNETRAVAESLRGLEDADTIAFEEVRSFTVDRQRQAVRAAFVRVSVRPGRGDGRLDFEPRA